MPIRVLKFVAAFGWGGTERQFVNLAIGLDKSRFEVRFGCLRRFGAMLDELAAAQIPVDDYGVFRLRSPRAIAAQIRLARDIRRHGIQIVHTYGLHAHLFAIPAAKLAGAQTIASIRDMGVYHSPVQRTAQRWICKLADSVLVNADAIKQWLVADGFDGSRIHTIPNGIDLASRNGNSSIRADLGLTNDAPLVAVAGRVSRKKGLEDFITAAASVAPRFPSARFLIIGEPSFTARGTDIMVDHSYEEELGALAAKLGIRDRVMFTGFRSDLQQILPELAISVLPSLSEGLSNALLESMAAGVAVVATRVGGAGEVIRDGENGFLIPPGDPNALALAMSGLLESRELAARIGAAAKQRIAERYSVQRLVEDTSRFYESRLRTDVSAALLETTP